MRLSRTTTRIGIVALAASLLLASWSAIFAQELIPPAGADLAAVSPAQPEIAFAAAGAVVFRSEDGGATWQAASQLASPARSATAAIYAPIGDRTGLRLPGWLAAAAPLLRWLILGLALAAIAVLPWLQGVRGDRRRRHN